jgi:hypothetical protein
LAGPNDELEANLAPPDGGVSEAVKEPDSIELEISGEPLAAGLAGGGPEASSLLLSLENPYLAGHSVGPIRSGARADDRELGDQLLQFLDQRIDGVEEIETLLALAAEPFRRWSAYEVARRLKGEEGLALRALTRLHAADLVSKETAGTGQEFFTYAPGTRELRESVELLERAFRTSMGSVFRAVSQNSLDRLRAHVVRAFTDGSVVRKRREG